MPFPLRESIRAKACVPRRGKRGGQERDGDFEKRWPFVAWVAVQDFRSTVLKENAPFWEGVVCTDFKTASQEKVLEPTQASLGRDEIEEYAFVVVLQVGEVVGEVGEVVAGAHLQVLAEITIDRGQRAALALTDVGEL